MTQHFIITNLNHSLHSWQVRKEMRAMKEFFKEENEKIAKSIAEASAKQVRGSKSKVAMGLGPSRKQLT